jgi:hypothetical protein
MRQRLASLGALGAFGHANVQTTETYLRADPTQKLDTLKALTPPQLRRGRFRPPDKVLALPAVTPGFIAALATGVS